MPTVTLQNVTKRFRKVVALNGISLDVQDREFFTIIGPTNAGKTTTLRVVAGLEKPTNGAVLFDGHSMNAVPPNQRDVAMMFQNLALYPHRNGFDNIAFPLRVQKVAPAEVKERVRKVAAFLKISHLLDRLPGTYSGGERQRLAFARTMVREPKLFMLDEPLANLDALIRLEMRVELKRIHQELGRTMIYVTHDQVEAMSMSERIAVLNKGVIQQVGQPDDIYMRPANRFVAGFFGSPPKNFIPVDVHQEGDRLTLNWAEHRVDATTLLERLREDRDLRKVTLGIRPEDLRISHEQEGAEGLPGKVVSLEQLGIKTVVDVALGPEVVRVSLPTTFDYKVRDRCRVSLNIDRGHLFSPDTEKTLIH